MSVNPILPELVAADVHVVPLAAGAGAPDLNTLPAVASPGRQASWQQKVHVRDQHIPLSSKVVHIIARKTHPMLCLQMRHTLPMTPVVSNAVHGMGRAVRLV